MPYSIEEIEKAFLKAVPFPPILYKVVSSIKEKKVPLYKLGQDIAKDPVMSAQILAAINSPYYALKQKISDIPHALSLLGFEDVSTIIFRLVSKSMSTGSKAALKSQLYSPQKNWLHTIKTAHLARILVRINNLPLLLESYLAGLMHDIGKNAIAVCIKREDEVKIIKAMYAQKGQIEAETEVLGFNHAQCGFQILKKMKISLDVLQAVFKHHDKMEADFSDMNFLLALANILSYFDENEDEFDEMDQILQRRFGITRRDIPGLHSAFKELKLEMEAM
ncbi:MAG: HDOD domain-containing protein [bacterium]|nr:HDOD domain-containing protein [bacterium]